MSLLEILDGIKNPQDAIQKLTDIMSAEEVRKALNEVRAYEEKVALLSRQPKNMKTLPLRKVYSKEILLLEEGWRAEKNINILVLITLSFRTGTKISETLLASVLPELPSSLLFGWNYFRKLINEGSFLLFHYLCDNPNGQALIGKDLLAQVDSRTGYDIDSWLMRLVETFVYLDNNSIESKFELLALMIKLQCTRGKIFNSFWKYIQDELIEEARETYDLDGVPNAWIFEMFTPTTSKDV
jgi:hypothetical protein